MDITSYLFGKKGAGGGGSSHDWSTIGYNGEPQAIKDGYNYAVEIMENWDANSTMTSKFENDKNLLFMPLVDISKASNLNSMFKGCYYLMEIPNLDYSQATYMDSTFQGCNKLKNIHISNTTARMQSTFMNCESLETITGNIKSHAGGIRTTFSGCTNLKNIPVIDCSLASGSNAFQGTFQNCPNLTDTSLDNILQTCISATSYSGTKTLARLGFTSDAYSTSRIQALPHYQDFTSAGWTIGY